MKKSNTSERLKQIMSDRSLRQVDILRAAKPFCEKYGVKLEKNDLSQYVSGKVEPGQEKLTILGLALNVSEAWLMGYDVAIEREKSKQPTVSGELSDSEKRMLELFRRLSPEAQETFPALLEAMLKAQGLL